MEMIRSCIIAVILATGLMSSVSGCGMINTPLTQREQTTGIGALAGGAAGALIGSFAGSAVAGGLFGIPLGAVAGFLVAEQLERGGRSEQAALDDRDAEIQRLRRENERLRRQEK
jgi:hypothetical protein